MGSMMSEYHRKQAIKSMALIIMFMMSFLWSCTNTPTQQKSQVNIDSAMLISLMKEKNATVIDTMSYLECMDHRIPGSQCIALEELDKKLPLALPDKKQPIIFYCESDKCPRAGFAHEKAKLLGYENIYVLEGGLTAWKRSGHEVETIQRVKRAPVVSIKSAKLQGLLKEKKNLFILDVRSEDAFSVGHIDGATNIPFYLLHKKFNKIPKNVTVVVVDENGKRSFLACCFLINNGIKDVIRLFGGMESMAHQERDKG